MPVWAPPNGSTVDGWLCVSPLKQTQFSPSNCRVWSSLSKEEPLASARRQVVYAARIEPVRENVGRITVPTSKHGNGTR